jgi:endonuclease YncB( thermonuclease family)
MMTFSAFVAVTVFRRLMVLAFAVVIATGAQSASARGGADLPPGLAAGAPGTVVEVTDGDTVVLNDGRIMRLVGIQAPKLPLGRPGFPSWPLAPEARRALEALAINRRVTPHFGGARRDRHGRVLAHLARDDGIWLQGEMLALGLARVYTFEDNRAATREMYALERGARAAGRGIWSLASYRIRSAEEAGRYIGGFELVEGRILDVAVVRGRGYLNFGRDWRTDFTVVVPRRAGAIFHPVFGRKMEKLQGKRIRVRGWLRRYNGPMIESTHPEQIEVLEP